MSEKDNRTLYQLAGKANPGGKPPDDDDKPIDLNKELSRELKEAMSREQMMDYIGRIKNPLAPAPQVDPSMLVKSTFETARDLSKEERDERRAAEQRARDERIAADAQKQAADAQIAGVRTQLDQERFDHQKDVLASQVVEMQRLVGEIKTARVEGNEAPSGKIREIVDVIQVMQSAIAALSPQKADEHKATPVEEMTKWMEQLKQLNELLGTNKPATQQLVNMADTAHLPPDVAIAFKRLDLEDARLKEESQAQREQMERQRQTQEGLMGLIMGIGSRFLDGLQAQEAPPAPARKQVRQRNQPQMIEVECDRCHGVFQIAASDKDKTLVCPHCGNKDGE